MRVLLLAHSFNSLTQRLFVELGEAGHRVSVEFDINDRVTEEAVALFGPDLVVAPFLKRAIPESVWRRYRSIVIHPGIPGDRGPSALDWAIINREREWGVTALQANGEMDAGDIWASAGFAMRDATKASLYRNEVTEAAVAALRLTLARAMEPGFKPEPLDYSHAVIRGRPQPPLRQPDRAIDWHQDDTDTVLRKIRAADGFPGVLDEISGHSYYLYDAHAEGRLRAVRRGRSSRNATARSAAPPAMAPSGSRTSSALPIRARSSSPPPWSSGARSPGCRKSISRRRFSSTMQHGARSGMRSGGRSASCTLGFTTGR